MPTNAELQKTFEDLAVSQRANADRIEATAAAMGMPLGDLAQTVAYLWAKADECDAIAAALGDGDAFSSDDR